MLRELLWPVTVTEVPHPIYSVVGPIRMLHIKNNNKDLWDKLDRLMDHVEERRKDRVGQQQDRPFYWENLVVSGQVGLCDGEGGEVSH